MQRSTPRNPTTRACCLLFLLSLGTAVGPGLAQQRVAASPSSWWPEVQELDKQLRKHKWKSARRETRKLADQVVGKSWYGPELGRILAELALFEAIADANLGRNREAIWFWHLATNLDSGVRSRDLGPYGRAGKLLHEFPLRARGEIPVGFEDRGRSALPSTPPKPPAMPPPTVLSNSAVMRERTGDFHVELIVDQDGRLHHPVVVSTYLHPIVIYAVLKWLLDAPPFEPRRIADEPTDSLFHLAVEFRYARW